MSLFPTIITKDILGRNVALISFVGMIATIVGKMGAVECTALTIEEECDDMVGATSGG
jgi:hypothetical protein